MKIVFAASEMVPYAKTGGLADVAGTLPKEIHALEQEVFCFLPCYRNIDLEKSGFEVAVEELKVPVGTADLSVRILHRRDDDGVQIFLVDYPEFYGREGLYGGSNGDFPDNDRRFILFQRAILELLKTLDISPDVIHCHDWQTGLLPVYLKTLYAKDKHFKKTKCVFTVHNLAYQGNFPPDTLPTTGISWDEFKMDRLEFYGKVSFLKAGLVYADAVTTVSERYSKEIQTKEFGCGLETVLAHRNDHLFGVINGIDYGDWNPETDEDIARKFSASDPSGKAENKAALQRENGFEEDPSIPVIGFISRLVDQKGLDILIPALEDMSKKRLQFVLLGTGEERYHKTLREIAKRHKKNLKMRILFDSQMAKRIYAGSDFLLVPSYYEPCGLGQMIALRFGTIPIVRATGGLADSVEEVTESGGNGFLFEEYSTAAFLKALDRAIGFFDNRDAWDQLVHRAMQYDFSWHASAKKYLDIFERTQRGKIPNTRG